MKKLMVAAAAAAMINGAFADGKAYVYYATLDVRTTQGEYCSKKSTIECGEAGSDQLVRKWDDYSICGYIFGCENGCAHLKNITDALPNTYSKAAVDTAKGEIFWDTAHKVAIVPSDSTGMWNSDEAPIWKYSILNVVGPDFDRTESVFAFTGKAKFFTDPTETTVKYSKFDLTCAGIGVYGRDEQSDNKAIWLRSAGNAAGSVDAVYLLDRGPDGTAYAVSEAALGYQCNGSCGENSARGATAAYGTWTLTYCQALSAAYGLTYAAAIEPYVEPYAAW